MKIKRLNLYAMAVTAAMMSAALAQDAPVKTEATAPLPPAAATPSRPGQPQAQAPQAQAPQAQAPQAQAPQAPAMATATKPAAQTYSQEQLDQLVAPVALYPDQLLGQILMAATYPLEIVEADRWVHDPAHKSLQGDALAAALKPTGWDPSVMSLVAFHQLLDVMNDRIDWMRDLGTAVVAQRAEVMAAVQRLRHLAMAAGSLKATPQCHCTVAAEGDTITIAAIQPGPVCIPAYSTRVVYGHWPHPAYPPAIFPVPMEASFEPGFFVGFYPPVDVALYGPLWGWDRVDWGGGRIIVDADRYRLLAARNPGFVGGVWVHDSSRRGAVIGLASAAAAVGVLRGHEFAAVHGTGFGAAHAFRGHYGFHGARFARAPRFGGRGGPHFAMGRGHFGGGHFGGGHFGGGHFGGGHFGGGHFGGGHFGGGHFGGGGHMHFAMGGGMHGGGGHHGR
ncbi:MAG TPA: DUF3300 domain-containing protein [Stellaceae bacterium]|nr:DUF3300 domain-containing protein [Stellaceae bacterium]